MKVSEYLELKDFQYDIKERPSGENYIMVCPFCNGGDKSERSFAINANSGLWNCKRMNNCGKSGTFFQLQEMLGDIPKPIDPFLKSKKGKSNKIKNYKVPKIVKIPLSKNSTKYLQEKRKFTKEIISQFELFESIKGEINLPYIKNGVMVNVKSRKKYKKDFTQCKDAEPCLFNRDNVKIEEGENNLLIITEGEYDCIALTQYGIENVVSVPNGTNDLRWIENEWEYLEQFNEIYINMDIDSAGQNAVMPIVNRLGIWRCKSIKLPYKDANECLINNVSNREILQCFENAEEFDPVELKTAGDFCEEVIDIFKNPDRYNGIPTGIPELDKLIRGWRFSELTIWTGQGGSGKSTMLNQCCLLLAHKEIKVCIASLELRPARYLKWAVQQVLGKENPTEDEIIKTFEWLDEWLLILNIDDTVYGSKLFELFEYAVRKHGIKHFVVDSLMKIRLRGSGDDKDMSQVEFVMDYKSFAKRFGVHCHLVAHPRKQESDKDKPGKVDVKGRGEITDVADNVIIIWRNFDDEEEDLEEGERIDGLLIVRKNREFGDLGTIQLMFDKDSRRYLCRGQYTLFS